ncbi:MAG TPA: hypothetical protein VMU54_09810 [Planctomycetota bacterium]|nr:hypothetical protein [Planctomycetota bacterium]
MPSADRAIEISERVFRRLLRAYPPSLRAEYEEPMVQLFGDLCRDARNRRGGVGLIAVWAFILRDTAGSLILEYANDGRSVMDKFRRAFALKIRQGTLAPNLAQGLLSSAAVFVLVGSVLKLTSLPLTEGQLLIGLLCACAVSIQLTILGILVTPRPVAPSIRRFEG